MAADAAGGVPDGNGLYLHAVAAQQAKGFSVVWLADNSRSELKSGEMSFHKDTLRVSWETLLALYTHEGAHTLHFPGGSQRVVANLDHERFAVLVLQDGKETAAFGRLSEAEREAVRARCAAAGIRRR